jgi:hypothetical protein
MCRTRRTYASTVCLSISSYPPLSLVRTPYSANPADALGSLSVYPYLSVYLSMYLSSVNLVSVFLASLALTASPLQLFSFLRTPTHLVHTYRHIQ